ncbi:histidine phosphatase family protein [uncultured Roseobacter sp.]|uniref:SixA phosphatase family protein n=1 Tax=uncultured Roseobacter sp. TaxID=114847 RepID=UPI002627E4AF|nr:histidine phosphatase family protein [uncultured Roseobacter sp.]
MRRLILMRHAKSDWGHVGLEDHDRPLNKRGKAAAKALGAWLRQACYVPDQVICSSAERTGQTLLGLDLPTQTGVSFTRTLYLAGADEMRAVLSGATAQSVLMIGHNPGIAEMAERLVAIAPDHPRFLDYPTGATLVVDFDIEGWNEIGWHIGQPIDFIIPHELA